MKVLWALLALLLVAAVWSLRDPGTTALESCDAPPWELLDQARKDDVSANEPAARRTDGAPAATAAIPAASAPATPSSPSAPSVPSAPSAPSAPSVAVMPPGAGTERQPFRVSWELLGQASGHVRGDGTFDAMPRTLELLGGTWIELSGYYAPAIIAPSTDELVLMLNRWDGCCIGLPPTPYDSALVKTRAPIDFSLQHQIRFGTLRGRLVLEPFALGGLVLGLYRIEDAELLR
jgi:hypothetical protein